MADGVNPPNPPAESQNRTVDQAKIDQLTDKSGPRAGDFVKVGDKLYTAAEIQQLEQSRSKLEGDVKSVKEQNDKWQERAKKVYGNPDNPDREALKEFLMAGGRSADEADQLIREEFGDTKDDAPDKGAKGKGGEAPPEEGKAEWGTRAWLQAEFEKSGEAAFAGNTELQKFVDAAAKREDTEKEGKEAADFVKGEILGNIAIRTQRILTQRVNREGTKAFQASPLKWFQEASLQAASEEASVSRKRYGNPNIVGSKSGAAAPDPIKEFLDQNKPQTKARKFNPEASKEEVEDEFAKRMVHAVFGDYNNGNKTGV